MYFCSTTVAKDIFTILYCLLHEATINSKHSRPPEAEIRKEKINHVNSLLQ